MKRALFLFAGFLLASSAIAQLTPEQSVSTPRPSPAPGDQSGPVIATNGSEFLVAWTDFRGLPGAIYANRVTREGRILDGTGIRIQPGPGISGHLLGAFFVDGAYAILYAFQERVEIARISENGDLIEPLRTIFEGQPVRAAAATASRIVVVAGNEIDTLDMRGNLVASIPMAPAYGVSAGTNGSSFLVSTFTYDGTNHVDLIALDANGKQTDMTRVNASASGDGPIIGSDGADFLVIYDDARRGVPIALTVSPRAEVKSSTISGSYSALLWTGDSYLATTNASPTQEIALARVDRSGAAIGAAHVLGVGTPGTVNRPAAAWNGSEALFAWTAGSQADRYRWEIIGALAEPNGNSRGPFQIPRSTNKQELPVIATSGEQDLVSWIEPDGIFAARLTAAGDPLDGRGIQITEDRAPLRAIYDGSAYVIAWGGTDGIKTRRLDPNSGALLGPAVDLTGCARSFDLAMGDSPALFFVPCGDNRVFAQRLGATDVIGAAVPLTPSDILADQPRAAWNGSQWLVAWMKLIPLPLLISPPAYRGNVYATRVSAALTPVDAQPIPIAVSDFSEFLPFVATDRQGFVIAWSHDSYNAETGLYVRRVADDGSVSDPSLVARGPAIATSFIRQGNRYALAFTRNGDLFLTRLNGDEVPISATFTEESSAALAVSPGRPLRIVYTRVAPEPEYGGVSRVFMRDELSARRRSVRVR